MVYGAWARVNGWLQNSPEYGIWCMGQGQWVAPEFSRIWYMVHGPGSMGGSRILQNLVYGAWARVNGWLQNSPEYGIWCMGQGQWVAPEFSRIWYMVHGPGSMG